MAKRKDEGAAGRTINIELGELSRTLGRTWNQLWPRVKRMEERKDIGRALSDEEEWRLVKAVEENRSPNLKAMVPLAILSGMRAGELSRLTWGQVDFEALTITVGKAKTAAGSGRMIPMNGEVVSTLSRHPAWFTKRFKGTRPEQYVFPYGTPYPSDPSKPTVEIETGWESIRKAAGVECRWHDLRHTTCTKLAEAGTPESTMLALMGHMSRRMLEHYSHIRMAAKRTAMDGVTLAPKPETVFGVPQESPKVGRKALLQ